MIKTVVSGQWLVPIFWHVAFSILSPDYWELGTVI